LNNMPIPFRCMLCRELRKSHRRLAGYFACRPDDARGGSGATEPAELNNAFSITGIQARAYICHATGRMSSDFMVLKNVPTMAVPSSAHPDQDTPFSQPRRGGFPASQISAIRSSTRPPDGCRRVTRDLSGGSP